MIRPLAQFTRTLLTTIHIAVPNLKKFTMNVIRFIPLTALIVLLSLPAYGQDIPPELITVAESSGFTATSRSQQVVEFVDNCAKRSDFITRMDWGTTVEGRPMVSAVVANPAYDPANPDDRLVVLLLGNIHSGECAGKEGLLMLLRELTLDANHPWLKDAVVIIAPNYNADGNDRMGKNHRPGQHGPEQGMGVRENAQQLDLNRDFMKLESPEARALVSLINKYDPHVFMDLHTTNGSQHRYQLTYDIPHNPNCPKPIRDYLRNIMMPSVTAALEKQDYHTFYYGNFNRDNTQWTTYGHEARYSTEYAGIRGRIGILSEAYSYASYETRVRVSKAFTEACVNFARENSKDIRELLEATEEQVVAGKQPELSLDAQVQKFDKKCTILGYDGDQPKDYECDFIGDYKPINTTILPHYYMIPREFWWQVDRLRMHGIKVVQGPWKDFDKHEQYMVKQIRRSPRPFQGHEMLKLETEIIPVAFQTDPEMYYVSTRQPLGLLAAALLEPESNDSLATWNFFDRDIKEDALFPVMRGTDDTYQELDGDDYSPMKQTADVRRFFSYEDLFGAEPISITNPAKPDPQWVPGNSQYRQNWTGRQVIVDADTGAMNVDRGNTGSQAIATAIARLEGINRGAAQSIAAQNRSAESDEELPEQKSDDGSVLLFQYQGQLIVYDSNQRSAQFVGEKNDKRELVTLSPNGKHVAFVLDNNLYCVDIESKKQIQITADGSETILNGKLDWVYQEELYGRGNFKSFWWSPDSASIAFLRLDESPVLPYVVHDTIPTRGRTEVTAYPKAGDPLPKVQLGIANVANGAVCWMDLSRYGETELLISRVGWSDNPNRVVFQVQDRVQTWLDLCVAQPGQTSSDVLFRDQGTAWIESPGNPRWLSDGSFLWLSPSDGGIHIYHYDANGKLIKQITRGNWEVRSLEGISPDETTVFFTAAKENAIEVNGYRVDLNGSNLSLITQKDGSHSLKFDDNFEYFFDTYSTAFQPPRIDLVRSDGTFVRTVDANLADQLMAYAISEPEFVKVPTDDSETLDGMLIKPPNFDPQKQYPVLVHVYSGPQAPTVQNLWRGNRNMWHQLLAQRGYIVWMCDNRSATYRPGKYAWPIHQNLGSKELADIEQGVNWLKSNSWVDPDRIGIWGWSYGGYMTAYAMTHSTSFRAGIAGAPVTDWRNYDAIYTERYMGLPQNNEKGYDSSSVIKAAENLHGSLLLIHGTQDDNVHIGNTYQLVYALQNADKQFELMVYPKNRHGITEKKQQLHMYKMMTKFILKNL
jgi:dipeptidyl-peptidase 4